jgi:hypothetical protein
MRVQVSACRCRSGGCPGTPFQRPAPSGEESPARAASASHKLSPQLLERRTRGPPRAPPTCDRIPDLRRPAADPLRHAARIVRRRRDSASRPSGPPGNSGRYPYCTSLSPLFHIVSKSLVDSSCSTAIGADDRAARRFPQRGRSSRHAERRRPLQRRRAGPPSSAPGSRPSDAPTAQGQGAASRPWRVPAEPGCAGSRAAPRGAWCRSHRRGPPARPQAAAHAKARGPSRASRPERTRRRR